MKVWYFWRFKKRSCDYPLWLHRTDNIPTYNAFCLMFLLGIFLGSSVDSPSRILTPTSVQGTLTSRRLWRATTALWNVAAWSSCGYTVVSSSDVDESSLPRLLKLSSGQAADFRIFLRRFLAHTFFRLLWSSAVRRRRPAYRRLPLDPLSRPALNVWSILCDCFLLSDWIETKFENCRIASKDMV